jgi:hypothetical protein
MHTLISLIKISAMNCTNVKLGGEHTRLSFEILRHWCRRAGLDWGRGLGIGGGEMIAQLKKTPVGRGPKKNLGKELIRLAGSIGAFTSEETRYVSPNFFKTLFVMAATIGWKQKAKHNKLRTKDLYRVI